MTVFSIPVDKISVSGDNPRQSFDEQSLKSLAESIGSHGLLQPILVRPKNGGYELVVGERRFRAVKILGQRSILAKVEDVDDATCAELRLIENTHREDLTDAEKGDAVYALIGGYPEKYPTIQSVADAISKPYGTIQRWTKKANRLSQNVRNLVIDDQLDETDALLLLKYNHQTQNKLAKKAIEYRMTQRQVRAFLLLYDKNINENLDDLANKALGTKKVEIDVSKLTPKVRKEVEKILEEKKKVMEEKRKERLKKRRKAPRVHRPRKPKKHKKKNKFPSKPSSSIFDENPSEGVVFTTTIPTNLFRQVTDLAQELGSTINETIEHIVTKFFEWRSQHD